jgi:hypothetical protein
MGRIGGRQHTSICNEKRGQGKLMAPNAVIVLFMCCWVTLRIMTVIILARGMAEDVRQQHCNHQITVKRCLLLGTIVLRPFKKILLLLCLPTTHGTCVLQASSKVTRS